MKKRSASNPGFTVIELAVVLTTVAILFSLLLPAMAKARIKSTAPGCLNNLRQMMVGWAMYKDDNNDILLPNAPLGIGANKTWCGDQGENWASASANTNQAIYLNALLAPYIANQIELYHCPADTVPSDNGLRLRSYSMNGQMGAVYSTGTLNSGWKVYINGGDLTCPTPENAFVFADESMCSLNDGFMQNSLNFPKFADVPAAYHEGAGSFSFADGHAQLQRWSTTPGTLLSVPYRRGVTRNNIASSSSDPDWRWLTNHASCKQ